MRGKRLKAELARVAARSDEDIDYSDIPPITDFTGFEIGKFHRPPKKMVTIRLDEDVLNWVKGFGKGYQTRVNALLRQAMLSVERQAAAKPSR
jgi:uncharacterized protein (DUF4415 family)